ncbi:MAG: acyltransferase [Clostridia bacterium]|nr:acyltransferase [Clostridia bacterium]
MGKKKKKKKAAAPEKPEKLSIVGGINKYRGVIMGVAALMIFLFHHWTVITPSVFPNHPTLGRVSLFAVTHGHAGVDIFFLLSGIGLVWAADKSSVGRFYIRRIKRVYIPFLICYAVLFLLTGQSFLRWLQVVNGYTFLFENMYSVLWFVPAVLILYLLFPLYNFLLKKLRFTVLVTVAAIGIWYLCSLLPIRYDLYGFYNRIPVFLIGVMLGRLEKDGKFPKSKLFYLAGPVLFAAGVVTARLVEDRGVPMLVPVPNCFIPTLCLGTGTVLILAFILDFLHRFRIAGKVADFLSVPFSYLGKTSLEFYLVQMFTVRGILYSDRGIVSVSTGSTLGNDLLILTVAVGLSFVLATVSGLVCRLIPEGRTKG